MIALLLMEQIGSLFLIIGCGFLLVKLRLLAVTDSKPISVLIIYAVFPCVMIHSFQLEYSRDIRDGFLLAVLAAVIIHAILLSLNWLFGKLVRLDTVEKASLAYSNSGNLIIPLVSSVLGPQWVIYSSGFICVQMAMMWTHGQCLVRGKGGMNWRDILCNMNLVSITVGVVLFFAGIRLPAVVAGAVGSMAALMGPASMIMLGIMLAGVDWREVFSKSRIYLIAAMKMMVFPGVVLLFLKYSGLAALAANGRTILLISLLAVVAPSATTIVQLAQIHGKDAGYASAINVLTTVACILTMPLMVMLYTL